MDLFFVLVQDLDVERQALELLDQDLERLRHARWLDVLALDDGFVRLDAAHHVVALDRQELLQDVRGAVRLERPNLHLAEALAAELGLAAERLLGDEAVGAGRAGVDLVLDQVVQLEHVDVANGDFAVEGFAASAVVEHDLARLGQAGGQQLLADLVLRCPVEDRRGRLGRRAAIEFALLHQCPAEVGLEDLADVHARRHAQRIQDDVDGPAVRKERHVLLRQDLGHDALVAVAAGHLVADADLALGGNADADEPVDAGQQLVSAVAVELANVDDLAPRAVGQAQAGVLTLARLLAEDRAQQPLLRSQLRLALGRDLADQDVTGLDFSADVHNAVLVEVLERFLADVRDVARDLLGTQLGVARFDLVLLDMDAGEQVLANEAI